MITFNANIESAGCCGVGEVAHFDGFYGNRYQATTWGKILDEILETGKEDDYAILNAWFMKPQGEKEYQYPLFMEEWRKHRKSLSLGTFVNPNTGNTIRGYAIHLARKQFA